MDEVEVWTRDRQPMRGHMLFHITNQNCGADHLSQDAGHHQATVYKAARSLSRSYGSAWMRQYVLLLPTMYTINLTHFPAGQKPEEEQHQLPPLENVPQDRGASQAELDSTTTLLSLYIMFTHATADIRNSITEGVGITLGHSLAFRGHDICI
jgi:hypothetical protein